MERIPEPDLMNEASQACAYAEADFAEPHNHCIELLRNSLPELPPTGLALDLGCGPGDIAIRFARAFLGWKVDGVDGSTAMLHYGKAAVRQAGLSDRIQLVESYLPEGDAPHSVYDLIFSNSLLHHLTEPRILWQSIHRWSRPNTSIFMMDLMRPDTSATAAELVDRYAANEPEVLRRDFYNSLLAAYTLQEVQTQLAQAQLAHLSIKSVSDRHLIVWGRCDR
jgi:cyclopropane fatty-acyl-phospholipid synthase-like methyltransferase